MKRKTRQAAKRSRKQAQSSQNAAERSRGRTVVTVLVGVVIASYLFAHYSEAVQSLNTVTDLLQTLTAIAFWLHDASRR
jgi:hypothetical protein